MKNSGMNTATSDSEIDMTVKPTSAVPCHAAASGGSPSSTRRMMLSSTTIASSTTRPTAIVSPISEMLFRLRSNSCISANVPSSDTGTLRLGISVADQRRRNTSITITTSTMVASKVKLTSWIASRIEVERSLSARISTEGGIWACSRGSRSRIASTTSTVLASGCRFTLTST